MPITLTHFDHVMPYYVMGFLHNYFIQWLDKRCTKSQMAPSYRWHQAITWISVGFQWNFNLILLKIQTLSVTEMHLKMLTAKCQPFCSGFKLSNEVLSTVLCSATTVHHTDGSLPPVMGSHKLFHSLLCTALSCLLLGLCQRTTCHWPLKNDGNSHQSTEPILLCK